MPISSEAGRGCAFPRYKRLTRACDYAAVFKRGKRLRGQHLTLVCAPSELRYARMGFAVSRKAARRAVDRNRIKRIARETFRHHHDALTGYDTVVMARPSACRQPRAVLRAELLKLWQSRDAQRVTQRRSRPSPRPRHRAQR